MDNAYNEQGLRSLYSSNEAVRTVLDFFGKRTRTRNGQISSMKIELRKGLGYRATTDDLYSACVEMEKTGYIRFEKEKEKESSRVIWKKNLPEILVVASARSEATAEKVDFQAGSPSHHPFRTMDGRHLTLPYFSDLAKEDAERIGKFYESVALPIAR